MTSPLQTLIDEGVCVLWHDYRRGDCQDLSNNSNHGVLTDTYWTNDGIGFGQSISKITVADSAELQLTEGCLMVLGDFDSHISYETLISKRDAGGINYHFFLENNTITLWDGASSRWILANARGHKCVAVNFGDGTLGKIFLSGLSIGNLNNTSAISVNDAPIVIGNYYNNGRNLRSNLKAVLIFSRKLTATEHSQIYAELMQLRWPKMPFAVCSYPDNDTLNGVAKTDWGCNISKANITTGPIENSPFTVNGGSWQIVSENIDSQCVKAIKCMATGRAYIPTTDLQQTPTEAAYGTWDLYAYIGAAGGIRFQIIAEHLSSVAPITQNGYYLWLEVFGAIAQARIYKTTAGITTPITTVTESAGTGWKHLKVTRTPTGLFTLDHEGDIGTGTDNTHIISNYTIFQAETAGQKVSCGNLTSNYAYCKYLEVI